MKRPFKFKKPKKCKFTGKSKFPNQKDAEAARFRIWSHVPSADIYDLHVYQCPHSQKNDVHFHVGHKSYFEKAQQQNQTSDRIQ